MLHDHYGVTDDTALVNANEHDLEDLTAAFGELRDALKQLQWYGLVNFNKIVGRLGKFGRRVSWPPGTNGFTIPDAHLAIQTECLKDLGHMNDGLDRLQSHRAEARRGSTKTSLPQQKWFNGLHSSSPLISASSSINRDDAPILVQILEQNCEDQELDECDQQRLVFTLLHFSILNASQRCTEMLLARISCPQNFGHHLHWLVIKTGWRKKLQDRPTQVQNAPKTMALSIDLREVIDQLVHVIHRLGSMLRAVLHKKDSFGRLPLHHAVQYGMFEVCQAILRYMKGYRVARTSSTTSSSALLPDSEGLTALDLAVLTGNAAITKLLIEDHHHNTDAGTNTNTSQVGFLPGNHLTTALKLDSFAIIQLLHMSTIDVNYKDHNDETALYLAVRSGCLEYVNILVAEPAKNAKLDLDAPEAVYGWTPLILACVKGYLPVMELLLRAGADPRVQDLFGWTAKDHAAFRGHLPMAKTLRALELGSAEESASINGLHQVKHCIRKGDPTFSCPGYLGQDVPLGYSQIYVHLGPLDTYGPVTAVNLSPYVSPDAYHPQREADFQVEIRVIGGDQSSYVIQLPILEDMANKPWRFLTKDVSNCKLAFNIFHANTAKYKGDSLLGSAVALLESLKQGLGGKRESLIRDFTIPILQKDTLNFIGTVTFYFLVITPFPHQHPTPRLGQGLELGEQGGPTIIGHRGTSQSSVVTDASQLRSLQGLARMTLAAGNCSLERIL